MLRFTTDVEAQSSSGWTTLNGLNDYYAKRFPRSSATSSNSAGVSCAGRALWRRQPDCLHGRPRTLMTPRLGCIDRGDMKVHRTSFSSSAQTIRGARSSRVTREIGIALRRWYQSSRNRPFLIALPGCSWLKAWPGAPPRCRRPRQIIAVGRPRAHVSCARALRIRSSRPNAAKDQRTTILSHVQLVSGTYLDCVEENRAFLELKLVACCLRCYHNGDACHANRSRFCCVCTSYTNDSSSLFGFTRPSKG
jgi:hypothetical protein